MPLPPELYSLRVYNFIQRYTALYKDCILYSYTAYTVYSAIQSPSDGAVLDLPYRTVLSTGSTVLSVQLYVYYIRYTCIYSYTV